MEDIKGILIDAGMVQVKYTGLNWFTTPNFEKVVSEERRRRVGLEKIQECFNEAKYVLDLDKYLKIETKTEEELCFREYYEAFSKMVPELKLTDEEIQILSKDIVYNMDKYKVYEDVKKVLPILKGKYKLALVSDAWPSMIDIFKENDLTKYYNSLVISSMIGSLKPAKEMYQTALDEIGLKPEECVFLDDNILNCKGAEDLGIKSILVDRENRNKDENIKYVIHDFYELLDILDRK